MLSKYTCAILFAFGCGADPPSTPCMPEGTWAVTFTRIAGSTCTDPVSTVHDIEMIDATGWTIGGQRFPATIDRKNCSAAVDYSGIDPEHSFAGHAVLFFNGDQAGGATKLTFTTLATGATCEALLDLEATRQ